MISEHECQVEWRRLFKQKPIDKSVFRKARKLVNQLPEASPLRVRFEKELEEIKSIVESNS